MVDCTITVLNKSTSIIVKLFMVLATIIGFSIASFAQTFEPDFLELTTAKDALDIGSDPILSLAGGGTLEFWVQPDWKEDPGYDPVIISNASPEGASYMVAILGDRTGLGIRSGEAEYYTAFDFTDGNAHHVAINNYEKGIVVLIDGTPQGLFDEPLKSFPASSVWIGANEKDTAVFIGGIASMRLWATPVEKDTLIRFAQRDVFESDIGSHPNIDFLSGISDFDNKDFKIIVLPDEE